MLCYLNVKNLHVLKPETFYYFAFYFYISRLDLRDYLSHTS